MRVCIVGHSLIHQRQYLFVEELRRQGVEVLEIFPERWMDQRREGGYEIEAGGIADFKFLDETYHAVYDFNPDIIYSMTEWWQVQAWRCRRWAKSLSARLVYFFWENLRQPDARQQDLIKSADLIVCGNINCQNIVAPFAQRTCVMPQVGIDTEMFRPISTPKKYDLVFVGRKVYEKGMDYVMELSARYNLYSPSGKSYEEMPSCYNQARVQVVPSLDTQTWMEQWPACMAESLACNVPVVAFDSGSIHHNYYTCMEVAFAPPNDFEELKAHIENFLSKNKIGGREWVLENMGNEIIAKKLIEEFEKI